MCISARFWTLSLSMLLASTLSAPYPASAANVFVNNITGTGARNFTDTTIWPSGIPPTSTDQAVINQGDGINDYVYVDSLLQIQRFNIGDQNTGGLELRNGAYLFCNQGSNQVNIGPSGSAANALPGIGYLRIQSGATLEQTGLMYIGLNPLGTGTVTLEAGGTHLVGTNVSIMDGTGTYNMQGGMLSVGGYLTVARRGTGTFSQAGGTVELNRVSATLPGLFIANDWSATPVGGGKGVYEISGGSLTVAASNTGVLVGHPGGLGGAAGVFRIIGSDPTVNVGGNYVQNQGSSFEVDISATGISPMNVGGNVTLDGILKASFAQTPTIGQHFTVMNYGGALTGTFTDFDALADSPMGANSVELTVDYGTGTASSIVLTVAGFHSVVPGDFNGDGLVNGADFADWQSHFPVSTGATLADGDGDGDGDVDGADFVLWQTNYGSAPAVASVPEPTAWLMASLLGAGLLAIRRKIS